jgi:hypothetical protein
VGGGGGAAFFPCIIVLGEVKCGAVVVRLGGREGGMEGGRGGVQ